MPFDLKLDKPPAGYATRPARGGEKLDVQVSGFLTPDDGEILFKYLEGVSQTYLSPIPIDKRPPEGAIACLVAIVDRGGNAKVYVNEVKAISLVQVKRPIEKGTFVFSDDIADIRRLSFDGISVPADMGVAVVLSAGWRKGLFFDYAPLAGSPRTFDLEAALGRALSYLMFRARLAISTQDLQEMFKQAWFPFISLKGATLEKMVTHASQGWSIDDLLDEIQPQVDVRLSDLRAAALSKSVFREHQKTIIKAIERYENKDWLDCCTLIYSRLEGILRTHLSKTSPADRASQQNMAASIAHDPAGSRHDLSLLLPNKFQEYIERVYFANFDPAKPVEHVGRNTVSHGVVSEDRLDRKAATIGMLILDQLLFLLP